MRRSRDIAAALAGLALLLPAAAQAEPTWRLEQPAPPAGAPFKVPLGAPGDLDFYAPNRGLLAIEGNDTVAQGLYFYDGVEWRPLATVCGGGAATTRIAWAGPDEFWTITEPSKPRAGAGIALCRFKGGVVVGSYSSPNASPDPFRQMTSAACSGPTDCWFGGIGSADAAGNRVGAFFLHWDGTDLRTVYDPQGRGVSDLVTDGDRYITTRYVGRRAEDRGGSPDLARPEPTGPRLIRSLTAGRFGDEGWLANSDVRYPEDATELLAADRDLDGDLWVVGGGAASGPAAPAEGQYPRGPIAVRRTPVAWQDVPLDPEAVAPDETFVDVAGLPGSPDALVATSPYDERRQTTVKARVAIVQPDGTVRTTRLPTSGAGRGAAAKVACPAPDDCWMVTAAGWLFHYTDGTTFERVTDPAFARRIDQRPNESQEQFVPDGPPVDDSQLFAPPPEAPAPTVETPTVAPVTAPALLTNPRARVVRTRRGLVLVVSFTLRRDARLGLVASRGGREVGRVRLTRLKKGRRALRLRVTRKRYPTKLRFTRPPSSTPTTTPSDDSVTTGDTVTTGGDTVTTGGDTVTTGGDTVTTR